jgi:hypothetical protein
MIGMEWNIRGSVWNRWDPHLHAPGTMLADKFAGDWETYLTNIEKSEPRIRALGVTDYFCIETYKEVRKRKTAGRLKDVELLFPNIELRLDMKTEKNHGINLHLMFSPDDPDHEYIIEKIIGNLKFRFDDQDYACKKDELMALARAQNPKQTDDGGAHRAGANMFKVSFSELQKLFRDERKWLSRNCLVAVAGGSSDGSSGLQKDASFAAFRQEVERFAHIIFSADPGQRDYWLGKALGHDRKEIEAKYGALKPCMHGSDAHETETVAAPAKKRYCWLKGDLSFETMRQAVLEPEYRVSIGEFAPPGPSPSETVDRAELTNAPFVATPKLPLNAGLVAIIGARGSGKTALMEFLAAGALALTSSAKNSSFLQRAGNFLGDAEVEIAWADGEKHSTMLHDPEGWMANAPEEARVCYLSQSFVERLCSSEGLATELRREIERVVFEATEQGDRMECDSFDGLSKVLLDPVATSRGELELSIEVIGDLILEEDQLREQVPVQEKAIKDQTDQIEKLQKEMKDILPKNKEAHAKKLMELETEYNRSEGKVEGFRLKRKHLTDLLADVKQTTQTREPNRFRDLQIRFAGTGLTATDWEAFRMAFKGDVETIINTAVKVIDAAIKKATEVDPNNPIDSTKALPATLPLNQLRTLRDSTKTAVGIDAQKQKKYEELQRTISQLETSLRKAQKDHEHAKGAPERRKDLQKRRRDEYAEVFRTYVEEQKISTICMDRCVRALPLRRERYPSLPSSLSVT